MAEEQKGQVTLARTLGTGSIILMGVGALLGGGIFTLLGPATGLAGPGLFLAMILGGCVAFLNLQMYIALGTTFPEAGGGYLWVRKGLGNFQGFLAGWMSWFAHLAACGVYALSFGYYAHALTKALGIDLGISLLAEEKLFGVVVVLIFGYLNWKGSKSSGKTGNVITVGLLVIFGLFIIAGVINIFWGNGATAANYTPLLPNGLLGVIAAASFFYIAFEGSEIQVQAGEETKNPQEAIKKGLVSSWAIVTALYIVITLIVVGVEHWQTFAGYGEGAIAQVAGKIMPFGYYLMVLGGLFANLAALNATIYSSSRVSFALARDKNIWTHLARIHMQNLTPHIAVVISTALIAAMVVFLPLFDVASAASLLFVLLFLQLNIAGIQIHYKWPHTKWYYRVPWFPLTPVITAIIYALLALTMLSVNLNAWVITIFWTLVGLVNYFAYTTPKSRARFEEDIVYEGSVRIGPKTGKRILLPLSPGLSTEQIKDLAEFSFALASQFNGEVVAVRVHEIPPTLALDPSVVGTGELDRERALFTDLQNLADDFNRRTGPEVKDINFQTIILIGRDAADVLMDVIKMEECDALLLHWSGVTYEKGVRFGTTIDRLLREANCDIIVVKNPKPIQSLIVAANLSGKSPYLALLGDIVSGVKKYFKSKTKLLSVLPAETPTYLKPDFSLVLKGMGLKKKDFDATDTVNSNSVVRSLLNEVKKTGADAILVGASQPRLLKEIRFGSTSELLAKYTKSTLIIARGHERPTELAWNKLLAWFKKPNQ